MAVKFGLIGYGLWGKYHARSIEEVEGAELVAICAESERSCHEAREEHRVDVYPDYRDLLSQEDVDVVDIVVPNHLHAEMALAALEAGKHLLLEKPMALTVKDCDRIIEAAAKGDRRLYIGHEERLSPLWEGVKRVIEEGGIGEVCYGMVDLWRNPFRLGSQGQRYDLARVGSWVLEEATHSYDLVRWFMADVGEPMSVYARANSKDPQRPGLHDNFAALMHFPGGACVLISYTLAAFGFHQTIKFTGTQGAVLASWSGAVDRDEGAGYQLIYFDGQRVEEINIPQSAGEVYELTSEIEEMVKVVEEGREPLVTGWDGREAVRLCLAAEESVRTDQVVQL
jgi:myo-inositol 2-dehydrogenase/D-chiro-inositol 1-dehydrogenase